MDGGPLLFGEDISLRLKPLHPLFVADVTGIDLRQPQPDAAIEAIHNAIAHYGVLVFRDQDITDDEQLTFSRRLGPLEETRGSGISKPHEMRLHPAFADISNLNVDNTVLARDNRRRLYSLGNMLWHSDSSFKAVPSTYSLLSARIPVAKGGETQFADMRAAYDALDEETRAEVEPLVCEHSLLYSRAVLGFTDLTEEDRATMRPVRQALVRTHPISGRKSLYLSSHIGRVLGWPTPEAMAFIRDLAEHATQPAFVYTHQWRRHDLVMWDNRSTMHRARRYDHTQVRDMRRTTVGDTQGTVAQAEAA
jgi:alpha-ketoglutarate-dependent 2,4-dichlorophenoxyacetate dioxygenase